MNYNTLKDLVSNLQDCIDHLLDMEPITSRQAAYYFWLIVLTFIALVDAKNNGRLTINNRYSNSIGNIRDAYKLRNMLAHQDNPKSLVRYLKLYAVTYGNDIDTFIKSNGYNIQVMNYINQSVQVL